jgi:hypothetical protein
LLATRTLSSSQARHGVVSETSTTPQCKLTTTGTEYGVSDLFDLTKMEPYNLEILYKSFTKYSNEVVLYLPRNSDLNQIARYGQDGKKLEVAHYAIMGASKVRYIPCGLSKTLLT